MAASATVVIAGDTLALSGVLNYDTVSAVDKQGQQWLQNAAPSQCNIELSGITYSSSVGIALLLGWLRVASQQKKSLHIQQLPASMLALARLGGLSDILT